MGEDIGRGTGASLFSTNLFNKENLDKSLVQIIFGFFFLLCYPEQGTRTARNNKAIFCITSIIKDYKVWNSQGIKEILIETSLFSDKSIKAWLNWETLLGKHRLLLCFPGWLN